MIDRQFVQIGGRWLHYRRAGSGPPVLALADPPTSSLGLEPLLKLLGGHRTVIAPDLPGLGLSEPIAGGAPTLEQYAGTLVELLAALGIKRVHLYSEGFGAAIAATLQQQHGDRVESSFVNCPATIDPNVAGHDLERLLPSLEPEWDGSHLVRAWAMVRDRHIWRPWFDRTNAARTHEPFPEAGQLYDETLDLLRAGREWGAPIRAASEVMPGEMANAPAPEMLAPEACAAAILGAPSPLPAAPPDPRVDPGAGMSFGFARTSVGLLFYRRYGPPGGRPLVMFHMSPGTSAGLIQHMVALGSDRPVYAFDNPGYGESAAVPGAPSVTDLAAVQMEALDALGIGECDLYGALTGAFIAIEIALAQPDRVRHLVLEALPLWRAAEAESLLELHAPEMPLNQDGSHMVWAWNIIRDRYIWAPWENKTPEGGKAPRVQAPFPDVQLLHERVLEFLKGARTYHHPYRAVFRHPTRQRLPLISVPTLAGASSTSGSRPALARIESLLPGVKTVEWPGMAADGKRTAAMIGEFLAT